MPEQLSGPLPKRYTMWQDECLVVAGSAAVLSFSASTAHAFDWLQTPPADGDPFTTGFYADSGPIVFSTMGAVGTNRGKVDWYIDGVLVASGQDWYNGSEIYMTIKTFTVTLAHSGWHTVKCVVNGKNAGSADYYTRFIKHWVGRAAD